MEIRQVSRSFKGIQKSRKNQDKIEVFIKGISFFDYQRFGKSG